MRTGISVVELNMFTIDLECMFIRCFPHMQEGAMRKRAGELSIFDDVQSPIKRPTSC